ncbi:heme biosynthesis HemY N-terminal domain-containing protein [Pseudomonas matsuisoli]|uniref:Heme biosynthesis protein HemY n=1 Tax=Pseudomonas matsuisoli TaxID=1515666 RepID=A0A917PWY3_9PSED|nr:heme biosynthesis HemY N-terminal domain-containing protein [Pseudomonas matsuisoli]GGJ96259.1 heme biosynthesis protein HemY [Pseudomonas matsuisoli]
MIRVLVIVLVLAAIAGALGYAMSLHSGYVLIAYQGFRYESTLWVFLGLLVAILVALILIRWLLRALYVSGRTVNPWSRYHRERRNRKAVEQGMLELSEARWQSALGHLKRAAESDPQPLLLYLGAARAANELGQVEERDALLERALERQPKAELAIALTHAELQEDHGDAHGAVTTLEAMRQRHPSHRHVLRQLAQVHQRRDDWPAVIELLPALRKQKVLTGDELALLERQAWRGRLEGLLGQTATSESPARLIDAWRELSPALREDTELVVRYAAALHRMGADDEAEPVLRHAIQANYAGPLVELYGVLLTRDPAAQLKVAERWLPQHPSDAVLLRCLGRLSQKCRLWGKARDYLESSLSFDRQPETCAELARLLAQLGEDVKSQRLFVEGLELSDRRLPALVTTAHSGAVIRAATVPGATIARN